MVTAVTDPTTDPVHHAAGPGRAMMIGHIWEQFLVRLIALVIWAGTFLGTLYAVRFAASLLGHDPDALGDMPVFVGLAVGVVVALAATFAVQRQLDRRRGGRR